MKRAFILAAGLGTRLKPWTDYHPKALVPVNGQPMLSHVLKRLSKAGFDSATVNVHHFADQIEDYLRSSNLPIKISVSDERDQLLETGGALLKASPFLFDDKIEDILVHNADILSNANLDSLYSQHVKEGNDVTLLVSKRVSSRCLWFDMNGNLEGWENLRTGEIRPKDFVNTKSSEYYSFSGIYVVNRKVVDYMSENGYSGPFPIMDFFLKELNNLKIRRVVEPNLRLIDIGKPETLIQANGAWV